MLHKQRRFGVKTYDSLDDLVQALFQYSSWTLCTGFRWRGLLFLNDSTHEDALQEYAVVREADMKQVESLTISWMKPEEFKEVVRGMGDWPQVYGTVFNRIEDSEEHRCALCA